LLSARAWEFFTKHNEDAIARLRNDWNLAIDTYNMALKKSKRRFPEKSDTEVIDYTLRDVTYRLPPLYCYCVAAVAGMSHIMTMWHDAALSQLLEDPDGYRKTWEDKLPPGLLAELDALLITVR
jgi:hypothetical protein